MSAFQGEALPTVHQRCRENPTGSRGIGVVSCRNSPRALTEVEISTTKGKRGSCLPRHFRRAPEPAMARPAGAHPAAPDPPGTTDCCARYRPAVRAAVPVPHRLQDCAAHAGCFPDSPAPCPTGWFADTGGQGSATSSDRSGDPSASLRQFATDGPDRYRAPDRRDGPDGCRTCA